jgi:hypothetical protein
MVVGLCPADEDVGGITVGVISGVAELQADNNKNTIPIIHQ